MSTETITKIVESQKFLINKHSRFRFYYYLDYDSYESLFEIQKKKFVHTMHNDEIDVVWRTQSRGRDTRNSYIETTRTNFKKLYLGILISYHIFPGDWIRSSVPISKSIFVQFLDVVGGKIFNSVRLRRRRMSFGNGEMCDINWSSIDFTV